MYNLFTPFSWALLPRHHAASEHECSELSHECANDEQDHLVGVLVEPGLRLGLINPVCADDYFPKEEQEVAMDDIQAPAVDREPWIDDLPSQLAAALPQQTESLLQQAEALLNPTEEIDEEISESPAAPADPVYGGGLHRSDSRPHSRTIRTRPVVRSAGRR